MVETEWDVSHRTDDRLPGAYGGRAGSCVSDSDCDWRELQEPATEQFDGYRADGDGENIERSCRHFAGSRSQRLLACGQQRQHYWNARGRLWRDTPAVGRRELQR